MIIDDFLGVISTSQPMLVAMFVMIAAADSLSSKVQTCSPAGDIMLTVTELETEGPTVKDPDLFI